jgi:hypothetical protein
MNLFVRHEVAVRHEAPSLTGRDERTRHRLVAAGRLKLGAVRPWRRTVRAASSPDNAGTCRYCQTVRVRQARREGVREEPVVMLRKRVAGSNLVDTGRNAARDPRRRAGSTPNPVMRRRWGGHGECLRRSRGDAVGVELDISLVDRVMVNVGTVRGGPGGRASSPAMGRFVVD